MQSEALSVTELTRGIKQLLELNYGKICLQGEISNLASPSSGHRYFNIKDDGAQISGVMFRSAVQRCRFELENGLEVLLHGRITVYEPRGAYQIIVDRVEPLGSGALQLAFEKLKAKLAEEGLFDSEGKKDIPYIPKGIGIVTSPTGAAVQDILNILERRFPGIPVLINPVSVQGEIAAGEIACAIDQFQQIDDIDVLIVGRGGGSIEDLWAFNEEEVARAIFNSEIPVISAVGHETDFTIADFVADLRAPTPSAAAELAVPLKDDLFAEIRGYQQKLSNLIRQQLKFHVERLDHCSKRLRSPEWVIQGNMLKVDELTTRLTQIVQQKLLVSKNSWEQLNQGLLFHTPDRKIEARKSRVNELEQKLHHQIHAVIDQKNNRLMELSHVLNSLSPLSIMTRGYAAVMDADKVAITSIKQVSKGARISVSVSDGTIEGNVEKITPK